MADTVTHQGHLADHLHVLQESLGVVDGGVEPGTRVVPATVQVLCPSRTPVAVNKPTQDIINKGYHFSFS